MLNRLNLAEGAKVRPDGGALRSAVPDDCVASAAAARESPGGLAKQLTPGPGSGSRNLLLVRARRYFDPTWLGLFGHRNHDGEHPSLVVRMDVFGVEV
jgi:hypothetical protein